MAETAREEPGIGSLLMCHGRLRDMALVIGDLTEIWTISADIQCSCAFIWGEPDESRTIYPITPTLPNPCLCFGCTTGTMQMNPHRVHTALVLLFLNFTVPAVLSLLAFKSDGGGPLLQTIIRWTDRPIPSSIRPIGHFFRRQTRTS
jgi:hypothetical protein